MTGRDECKFKKEMRARIAEKHGIKGFEYKECDFEGECTGTCPSCEAEEQKLNKLVSEKLGRDVDLGFSPRVELTMGMIVSPESRKEKPPEALRGKVVEKPKKFKRDKTDKTIRGLRQKEDNEDDR